MFKIVQILNKFRLRARRLTVILTEVMPVIIPGIITRDGQVRLAGAANHRAAVESRAVSVLAVGSAPRHTESVHNATPPDYPSQRLAKNC